MIKQTLITKKSYNTRGLSYTVYFDHPLPKFLRVQGITLGSSVYLQQSYTQLQTTPTYAATLLAHEFKHVQQWSLWGILPFILYYLYYTLIHGYKNNPFEVAATQYATHYNTEHSL